MKLKGKKIAVFLANYYEELEFWYPVIRMREEGANVSAVAPKNDIFKGKNGLTAQSDYAIGQVEAAEFDALIIPGGYAPDHMRRSPEMVKFVKNMNADGKPIAAICHAGWLLVSADIIKDKNVTGYYSIKDDLENAGAVWEDKEVVVDGNLITSRNPKDLPAFCRAIIDALS